MDYRRIKRNRARCTKCGDIIESKHVWDYRPCECKAIAIDGGTAYLRYTYTESIDDIELLTEYWDDEDMT